MNEEKVETPNNFDNKDQPVNAQVNEVATPQASSNNQTPPLNGQTAPSQPKRINIVLLIILILTFYVTIGVLGLVFDDISAGAASGTPETGYGIAFAAFLSPIVVGLILISILRIRRLRKQGVEVAKTVKTAILLSVVLGVIGAGYSVGTRIYENQVNKKKHAQIALLKQDLANKPITVEKAKELLTGCEVRNVFVEKTSDTSYAQLNSEIDNAPDGILQIGGITGENNQVLWVNSHANQTLQPSIIIARKNCPKFKS